jgi:DNA-binding transcriptional LysR family regulator
MAMERFNDRHPGVQVQVDILDSDKIHSYVSRGNYDFGLVHHPEHERDLTTLDSQDRVDGLHHANRPRVGSSTRGSCSRPRQPELS